MTARILAPLIIGGLIVAQCAALAQPVDSAPDDEAASNGPGLSDLLVAGAAAAMAVRRSTRMPRSLRMESETQGAYDEILNEVEPGPGYLARKAGAPDWLTLGGEHRTRFEYMEGQFRPGLRTFDRQLSHRTRLNFAIEDAIDPLRLTLVLQDSRTHLTYDDSNAGPNHVDQNDVQQARVDLVLHNFLGSGLPSEIGVGRLNLDLGRGRWIAQNNFRNSTNAYDGAFWGLGRADGFHAQTFAVWPVDKIMRSLNPAFGANEAFMWGTYVLIPPLAVVPWLRVEFDYLRHSDADQTRDFDMFGYRVFKPSRVRQLGFEIESQYQFGDIDGRNRFAHFQHGEIDYTFAARWHPEVQLKFDYASPDFDILYGRRSFELTPTGILGPFQRSNLISAAYRLLVQPSARFHAFFQHRVSWLADRYAPWVGIGMVDPTGDAGRFLGHTLELRTRWRVLENVAIQTGYTHFAHGRFQRHALGSPVIRDTNYFYFSTEVTF